ncbi:MAG TPA: acyl-CoA dehydrogenase family protein [Frankiaceae bacterium]|nr:acyl-CoA dehydrogenase family protein [Frankiaceae bacterium]
MDFSLTDDQESLRTLAGDIFGDKSTPDRVEAVENSTERFDRELWRELAGAGLLGIALPEARGGAGLGLVELALVCEQHGKVVAPVPLAWTTSAAMAIAEHGDAAQQHWVEAAAAGEAVLTGVPPVAAAGLRVVDGTLSGVVAGVPYAHVAGAIVVPVRGELYLLDPAGTGVTVQPAIATTREIHGELTLDHAPVQKIGNGAAEWWEARLMVALAATAAGITDAALHQTAKYTSERMQFEKPLSTFQGVALKAADAYVDNAGIRAAVLQAAWRLDAAETLGTTPAEASAYVLTAAWWAAEAGQHCVHITQHLHGGLGADTTYPIHRYFLWGKSIELYVGGASRTLARLGDVLVTLDAPGDDITIPGYAGV